MITSRIMRLSAAVALALVISTDITGVMADQSALAQLPPNIQGKTGIIFDENSKYVLFTGIKSTKLLDYNLWIRYKETGQTRQLLLPAGLTIGAALHPASNRAYVAMRLADGDSTKDMIYEVNIEKLIILNQIDLSLTAASTVELNSLILSRDGMLSFLASSTLDETVSRPDTDQYLFKLNPAQPIAAIRVEDTLDNRLQLLSYEQDRIDNVAGDTLLFELLSKNNGIPQLYFRLPKTAASRPVYGSSYHKGNDVFAIDFNRGTGDEDLGDEVVAVQAGQVIQSTNDTKTGYGQIIIIRHTNGLESLYAHLSTRAVALGQPVTMGQKIGEVGKSGGQTFAHLHFVLRDPSQPNGQRGMEVGSADYPLVAYGISQTGGTATCPVTYLVGEKTYEYRSTC